ncbi:MAG: trypsin-like peptidase domain-containing protein [Clostridia bacterium]|nr:trypsin-like peptidase domain-containing protein [Clostridia bacterium]
MKKKLLTILLSGLLAFSAVGLGGCAESAYDIAVKNGFIGTEQEWLASLQGADGKDAPAITVRDVYDAAIADGSFSGTFNEFLQQYLTLDVPNNNDVEMLSNNLLSTVSIYTAFQKQEEDKTKIVCSAGSGVIIDLDKQNGNATVITNYHVVYDNEALSDTGISDSIYLYLYGSLNGFDTSTGKDEGGDGIKAQYIGGSMDYDIAVLQISGSEVLKNSLATEAQFGDSNAATVGEKVFVIGNSQGLGIAISEGVLSVDSEYISMAALDGSKRSVDYRVMRTDAAINGGNSGGPMFNSRGEVIAIVNAKSIAENVENTGFALPAAQVQGVVENILNHQGSVKRATLGVMVHVVSSSAVMNVDGTVSIVQTLKVGEVELFSAAYGKLRTDDILQSVRLGSTTYPLTRLFHLGDILLRVKQGDTIVFSVLRAGVETTVSITLNSAGSFKAVD